LWDYQDVTYNSVHDAIINGYNGKTGYEAGFERYKETVEAACGRVGEGDVIGFVRLGEWDGWMTSGIPADRTIKLGAHDPNNDKDGWPFTDGPGRTIAAGGRYYGFADIYISNDRNAPLTLPGATYPGAMFISPYFIPAGEDPGPLPTDPPEENSISTTNTEDIFSVHRGRVVVKGTGTIYVYNNLGQEIKTAIVNGTLTVNTAELPLDSYTIKYLSKDGKISHSVKIVGGPY
jgi:hypothetical protein